MNSQDYAMVFSKHFCPDVNLLWFTTPKEFPLTRTLRSLTIAWQLLLIIMHCEPGQAQVNFFLVSSIPPAF